MTTFDNTRAIAEGWWLSERDNGYWEIQKLDCPEDHAGFDPERCNDFQTDDEVREHLRATRETDSYYDLALMLDGVLWDV